MAFIKGYKYFTESEVVEAREKCDAFYGIPATPESTTQNWCEFMFAELQGFYYIIFDESLLIILGQPEDIEIIQPPMPGIK